MIRHAFLVLLLATAATAQVGYIADRAMGVNPLHGGGFIPISNGQVRVCASTATGSPCSPTAEDAGTPITDLSGNPLAVIGGNFGQVHTDVAGRFNFGCSASGNYLIQIAAQSSNTPQSNYLVSCPGNGSTNLNPIFTTVTTNQLNVANAAYIGTNGLSGQQSLNFFQDINGICGYYDPTSTVDSMTDVFGTPYWNNQGNGCQPFLLGNPLPPGINPSAGCIYAWVTGQGLTACAPGVFPNGVTITNGLTADTITATRINPALIGPALAPNCMVDGVTMLNLAACINYLKGTLGLQGGVIYDNVPEDFTVNPFRQSFAAQVFFGVGYNSTTCDSTHVNCWVTEVPLIHASNTKLHGFGRVGFGNNLSAGTVIINGNSFPAPLGIPTEGAITCNASGGFLPNGTYFVQVSTVNNLQTAVSSTTPIVGTSFPTPEGAGVVCANGGVNQSITVPSPSAVGSGSFVAQDYYVYASTTTGKEVQQPILTNNFSCGTPGVLDTTTCKMTSTATIKAIQTGTNPQPVVDTTNAMMVESGQQSQGAVTFGNDLRDITLQAQFQGVNSPNVMLYDTPQELSGAFGLNMNGTPGGYAVGTVGPAAGIYGSNLNLNSRYEHLQLSFSTNAGTLYPVILDGRDGGGQANGMARSIHDATIVAKTPGVTPTALIWILGTNPGNSTIGISEVHMEGINGNDCILIDQGATALVEATMCGGSTAYTVHVSSTGGGVVASGIASGTNHVLKDDVAGRTFNQAFINSYATPSLGFGNVPTVNSLVSALTIGSGSSIAATSLCATNLCPAGVYNVTANLVVTTACGTTGTYIVWLGWTDDQGAKTGSSTTTFIPLNGNGVTQATGALALSSTANYGQGTHSVRTTGAATGGLGAINYGTTATACGSGGPMVGKLYLTVTRMQ